MTDEEIIQAHVVLFEELLRLDIRRPFNISVDGDYLLIRLVDQEITMLAELFQGENNEEMRQLLGPVARRIRSDSGKLVA